MKILKIAVPLLAVGCAFEPSSGTYTTTVTVTENTCGDGVESGEESLYVEIQEKTATIDDLDCTRDGLTFSCTFSEEESAEGLTMQASSTLEVTWSEAGKAAGSMGMNVSCEGDTCQQLVELGYMVNCEAKGDVTMVLDEEAVKEE